MNIKKPLFLLSITISLLATSGCATGKFTQTGDGKVEFTYSSFLRKNQFAGLRAAQDGLKISSGNSVGDVESIGALTTLISTISASTAAATVKAMKTP